MIDYYIDNIKNDKTFCVGDDIVEKKLKGASSYAENFDDSIILYDNTVFGSAKEGFLLTSTHFSCKTSGMDAFQIHLQDIKKIEYKKTWFSTEIYINNVKVAECVQAKKESIRDFCLLIKLIIDDSEENTAEISHTSPKEQEQGTTHQETITEEKVKPHLTGKMFIHNTKKPPSAEEIFELIALNIEQNNQKEAENLCVHFIENYAEVALIALEENEFISPCPLVVKEFFMELIRKIAVKLKENSLTKINEIPGFLIGPITLYKSSFFARLSPADQLKSIKKAAGYFKIGVVNHHPASYFYLAEILERYPELAHELEITIEPSTLYWIGAMHKHPLALDFIGSKYISNDIDVGMFFLKLAAENGNIDSYKTLNGDFLYSAIPN